MNAATTMLSLLTQSRFRFIRWAVLFGMFGCLLPSSGWAYDVHDNTFLHNREGVWQFQDRTPIEAIAEFKAALTLEPPSSIAATLYHNWGIAACAMKDYPAAFVAFQQACRLQPTYIVFRQDLAHAYALAGKLHQAQTKFRDALALNPKDGEIWLLLGFLYQEQDLLEADQDQKGTEQKPAEPQKTIKEASKPKETEAPISSAPSYAGLARLCFEQYLKLQPESEMARSVKSILKQMPEESQSETASQPAPLPQEGPLEGAAAQGSNPPSTGTASDSAPTTPSPPGENSSETAASSSPSNAGPAENAPAPAPSDASGTTSNPPTTSPSESTPAPAQFDSSGPPSSPSNTSPSESTPPPAPSDASGTTASPSNTSVPQSAPAPSDSSGTSSSPSSAPSSAPGSPSPSLPSGP